MTKMSLVERAEVESVGILLKVLDADGVAEATLAQALDCCAQEMRLDSSLAVADRLRQGDNVTYSYFHDSLVRQVAQLLGALDEEVKAVYIDEYDASPEDLCFGEAARTTVIYLIVWVRRKTSALSSLATALDRALAQCYANLIGTPRLTHLLEVQVIDDAEVKNRVGYGALLSSIHFPPTEVWKR
jgi:hypothetical protein